ncbi:four helix bundle protein [Candidatus Peregrinibacteria bacterium]|nr:four helix bundle protein [Candidatus Peregrinibacteria bacterium]
MGLRPYEKLIAWQEALRLSLRTYQITKTFPGDERYCMTQQMRKSSTSVCNNIAEGNAKRSKDDRSRFIDIALGSVEELHCQYRISLELHYIDRKTFDEIDQQIHRVSYLATKLRAALHI